MTWLKKYNTIEEWETAKSNLKYQSVGLVGDYSVFYMTPPFHTLPIKAVFYDSATGSFVKMYPDEITEAIPTYTPIGVEVIPAEHDVYGTGQAGIMSLVEMNSSTPDTGSNEYQFIYWGGYKTDTSLPNYSRIKLIDGTNATSGYLPSDQFTGATSLDGVSKYDSTDNNAPSPYNANGSRNDVYYTTSSYAPNALSDFDGAGNTAVLTSLATAQSGWKTAITIANNRGEGFYPAACCCWRFYTAGTQQGQWYLPAMGELGYVVNRISAINTTINKVLSVYSSVVAVEASTECKYWSSSECSADSVFAISSLVYNYSKSNRLYARAFIRL